MINFDSVGNDLTGTRVGVAKESDRYLHRSPLNRFDECKQGLFLTNHRCRVKESFS